MKNSILVIGESGVGKTHYGAQLLIRLQLNNGDLSMDGAASNLEPFVEATDRLYEGRTAAHTPLTTYIESLWPVKNKNGSKLTLIWPDYAGEQISNIVKSHKISNEWYERIIKSSAWIIIIRPHQLRLLEDILSKPVDNNSESNDFIENGELSDQARLVELLQILLYVYNKSDNDLKYPKVCFLISCWDELNTTLNPSEYLGKQLPMLYEFIYSKWCNPSIMGLSALGKAFENETPDADYINTGPENFGYIVMEDGNQSPDLTLPIKFLI